MEIVGESLGIATDKGIWDYFRRHWLEWFPQDPASIPAICMQNVSG